MNPRDQGWILLFRKIWDSKDFNSTLEVCVFIYLLSKACHEPTEVVYRRKKILLQRGEVCIALRDLSKRFEITVKRVRTIIKNLVGAQNLAQRRAQTLSVYSIEKYNKYQTLETPKAQKRAQEKADRTNNNKININNTSISKKYDNKFSMKKIDITSSKPSLKDLKQTIQENESMSEFQIAKKRLSKDRFEQFVRLKLQSSSKS